MHGRIKVRTTQEEMARKKKEQALKVKAYRAAMAKIQSKRGKQEFDDEMLTLTAQILLRNPDVATLWNIRRECILKKSEELEEETDKQRVFDADLGLTEQCLMANPKSYACWHQRCWVLENCPKANWEREVHICGKYLKLDERNFHTWDYRRYVVAKANVAKHKELEFCTEMIRTNFSNYSSWHYRSQLLPVLYPCDSEEGDAPVRPMNEQKMKEELEMVLTAAFTDPNDSSAWFYQRWLLGNSRPELDVCAFRMNTCLAMVVFTKPVSRKEFNAIIGATLSQRAEFSGLDWQPLNLAYADSTWISTISCRDKFSNFTSSSHLEPLSYTIPNGCTKRLEFSPCSDGFCYFRPPSFSKLQEFSADVINELDTQLNSCNNLLEYEPDSKWTLLTSSLLMQAIDRRRHHNTCLDILEKLQKIDPLRRGYYSDLASKWIIELFLEDWQKSKDFPTKLDMSGMTRLTSIYYSQYFRIADIVELPDDMKKTYNNFETFQSLLSKQGV